jgi:uncharacterized membrane protein YtjA (UPF0391 family)
VLPGARIARILFVAVAILVVLSLVIGSFATPIVN